MVNTIALFDSDLKSKLSYFILAVGASPEFIHCVKQAIFLLIGCIPQTEGLNRRWVEPRIQKHCN